MFSTPLSARRNASHRARLYAASRTNSQPMSKVGLPEMLGSVCPSHALGWSWRLRCQTVAPYLIPSGHTLPACVRKTSNCCIKFGLTSPPILSIADFTTTMWLHLLSENCSANLKAIEIKSWNYYRMNSSMSPNPSVGGDNIRATKLEPAIRLIDSPKLSGVDPVFPRRHRRLSVGPEFATLFAS